MALRDDLHLIREEERKQNKWYLELGELFYCNCQDQAEGELKTLCAKISISKAQVEAYLEGDFDDEAGNFCLQCEGMVPVDSAYCNHCGVKLFDAFSEEVASVEEVEKSVKLFCEQCGSKLGEGNVFCTSCGWRV